ncbi:MAG: cofactor assembly of complex C subunit B [Microcystaceae cyanobacterium]
MNTSILSSTFLLTLLLMVGLFFFIRASVKDRTQQVKLVTTEPEESLLRWLEQYFNQRAYQIISVDPTQQQVTFQGFVRPSWFLAIFLTLLAAIGLLCFALVLSLLYPSLSQFFPVLILLAPAAGWFYWKKAGRLEKVFLKIEALSQEEKEQGSLVTITAHRDELNQLQQTLPETLIQNYS